MKHIIYISNITLTETPYGYKTIKIEPSYVEKKQDHNKLIRGKNNRLALAETLDIPDDYNAETAIIMDVIRQLRELGIMDPQDKVITYDDGDQTGEAWKDEPTATVHRVQFVPEKAPENKPQTQTKKKVCLDRCRDCCKGGTKLCYEGPYECQLEQIETLEKYGVYPECAEYLDAPETPYITEEERAIASIEDEMREEERKLRDEVERMMQEEEEWFADPNPYKD